MTELIARLTFDSWSDATPECRGGKSKDRHLIYEGEGVIIDLLIKPKGDGSRIHIGGQVLLEGAVEDEVANRKVLMEQSGQLTHTYTNALGEFNFHAVANRSLDLNIVLGKRRFSIRGLASAEPRMWQVVPSIAGGGS